jgi:hypothetical protein
MDKLLKAEHSEWLRICRRLVDMGVVTEEDLSAPVGHTDTPGQALLSELRIWGMLRAKQGAANDE